MSAYARGRKQSVTDLGKNLSGSGARELRRKSYCAHHIVAVKDRRAAYARAVLGHHGIGANDAVNGVWLKCRGVHRGLHTNAYYANLNRATRGGQLLPKFVIQYRLRRVAQALDNGAFPH